MGAIVAGVLAIVVVFYVLIRALSRRKPPMHEDPKDYVRPDILELVKQEAEEAGVTVIPGADDVELPLRLRVWHRDQAARDSCSDPALLRFVVTEGIDAANASEDDVHLVCLDAETDDAADIVGPESSELGETKPPEESAADEGGDPNSPLAADAHDADSPGGVAENAQPEPEKAEEEGRASDS